MSVESISTDELGMDYYYCENCDNEGFDIVTNGKCSCGSRRVYKKNAKVYRCVECDTGVSVDRDYIKGRCECD